jgi:hypothetical protein
MIPHPKVPPPPPPPPPYSPPSTAIPLRKSTAASCRTLPLAEAGRLEGAGWHTPSTMSAYAAMPEDRGEGGMTGAVGTTVTTGSAQHSRTGRREQHFARRQELHPYRTGVELRQFLCVTNLASRVPRRVYPCEIAAPCGTWT